MAKRTLDDSAEPAAAEVSAELERILRSRCFEHAGRASDFLRFVVGKTLAGEANRLKGYTIAIEVFGRPADFDARSDPLVRVEATRLRQRLTEYYAGEGSQDRVRLQLPRGPLRGDCQLCNEPRAAGRQRCADAVVAPGRGGAVDAHGCRGGCRRGRPGRARRARAGATGARRRRDGGSNDIGVAPARRSPRIARESPSCRSRISARPRGSIGSRPA